MKLSIIQKYHYLDSTGILFKFYKIFGKIVNYLIKIINNIHTHNINEYFKIRKVSIIFSKTTTSEISEINVF